MGIIVLIIVLIVAARWVINEREIAGPPSNDPRKPRRINYIEVPLMVERAVLECKVEFLSELTLFRGGHVMLGNQFFRRHDFIDYEFSGGRARRDKRSDELTVETATTPSEVYILKYRFVLFYGHCWFQLVRRFS